MHRSFSESCYQRKRLKLSIFLADGAFFEIRHITKLWPAVIFLRYLRLAEKKKLLKALAQHGLSYIALIPQFDWWLTRVFTTSRDKLQYYKALKIFIYRAVWVENPWHRLLKFYLRLVLLPRLALQLELRDNTVKFWLNSIFSIMIETTDCTSLQ